MCVGRNLPSPASVWKVFPYSLTRISQKLMKRRSYLFFFSKGRLVMLDVFTGTWKERRRKEMTSRRSLPTGTYVLYQPRVTLRSFVKGFRVHDVPTRHVQLSGFLSLSFSHFLSLSLPSSTEYRVSISPVPCGVPATSISRPECAPRACDVCTCYHA